MANITKRIFHRKNRCGKEVELTRYVLHYKEPGTKARRMKVFPTKTAAEIARNELIYEVRSGTYINERTAPTLRKLVEHFLKSKQGVVCDHTYKQYLIISDYINGPLLNAPRRARVDFGRTGEVPPDAKFEPMIGEIKINELRTHHIREWYSKVSRIVSEDMARRARQALAQVFMLAQEDFNIPTPIIPRKLGHNRQKPVKKILTHEQAKLFIEEMKKDKRWGLYVIFPFLTGMRIGEVLGLLWSDIDLQNNQIHIRHTQDSLGNVREFTKTEAGTRIIPIPSELNRMLAEWRERCPRKEGQPERVFPAQGSLKSRPFKAHVNGGGPLSCANFRSRVWRPALKKLGLPTITPHAARHMAISLMQAKGVEVALVSKIVGHSSPRVTVTHYSHPMSNAGDAMEKLMQAYSSN